MQAGNVLSPCRAFVINILIFSLFAGITSKSVFQLFLYNYSSSYRKLYQTSVHVIGSTTLVNRVTLVHHITFASMVQRPTFLFYFIFGNNAS